MSEKYLICVSACGLTSGSRQHADDLLDAYTLARELQKAGLARIEIVLQAVDHPDYPYASPGLEH